MMYDLQAVVREAGKLFDEGYFASKEVRFKGTVDLVTEYDVAIERQLTGALKELFPDFMIIGEESHAADVSYPDAIYIDPIDGTTNFVHSLPFCCISVGVYRTYEPWMGVVYNPILNEMFWATKGGGAFFNGTKLEVSKQTDLQQSLIATGFPYTKVDEGEDLEWVMANLRNLLPKCRDIRRFGSAALDLCYVAKGLFDGYYECNLKPWDVAAGQLIVREAGGTVSDGRNEDYRLGEPILVASNGLIQEAFNQEILS